MPACVWIPCRICFYVFAGDRIITSKTGKKNLEYAPKSKILRPVIIGSLFVIFCYMIPTDSNQSDIVAEISTESQK